MPSFAGRLEKLTWVGVLASALVMAQNSISTKVSFVEVSVTVTDHSGRLVEGLEPRDFTLYEDGVAQELRYFSSDPFPLSAAIILETPVPPPTAKKVNETLPALVGAFSEFDEVALYRYSNSVQQVSGFVGVSDLSTAALERLKQPGNRDGAQIQTAPKQSYVLNDAILRASQDLSRRENVRRRIIFVISDNHEYGSSARYDDVREVLLSQNISIYALGVDIPRGPGFVDGDILQKYVSDTGGSTFAAYDRQSIEQVYYRIIELARKQYTLGYSAKSPLSSAYRSIDVHVHRPDLVVSAKTGFYLLPPK